MMINNQEQQIDVEFFLALESQVWDALVAGDEEADARLLADNFLGVYSTGFAQKDEHVGQLATGPVAQTYALSQARLQLLGADVVLLAYKVHWTRVQVTTPESMYITSIWKQDEGGWRNIFSQDTTAES